jgi:hypothetical protein
MPETPIFIASEDRPTAGSELKLPLRVTRETSASGREQVREAVGALSAFGDWLGWGLLALGVLLGVGCVIESMFRGSGVPQAGRIIGVVNGATLALAFGLAGRGAAVSCRLIAAIVTERIERDHDTNEQWIAQAVRGADLLERLVQAWGTMRTHSAPGHDAEARRTLSVIEIERALRSERWAETESLIDEFEQAFPGDSRVGELRERLDAGRRQAIEEQMARLNAARSVNDPGRVIELYHGIVPSLNPDRREELARDLAKWFLELIHRRLRTGKIQAEVVLLATQVAETFGATVEGASMRAALPTLRRSVGLCPRCAQPYRGIADACPQCTAGVLGAVTTLPSEQPPEPS